MDQAQASPVILCISTFEKGQAFLREAARLGCRVVLLTVESLSHADWPRDVLADFITVREGLSPHELLSAVLAIAAKLPVRRVVPLDEFDLESAALAREHLRLPGMGESATRFFRDKLAMRLAARQVGLPVPEFCPVFFRPEAEAFMASVPGPWLLKPRSSASALGIKTIAAPEDLWRALDELGAEQTNYLLERFLPGDVFHIEGITWKGETLLSRPFQYGRPPIQTMHHGGVSTTRSLATDSLEARELVRLQMLLLPALGMHSGVTHTEFIRAHADGRFYFLETAARVGGAYIAETVEQATGLNLWAEWARIEVAELLGHEYRMPTPRADHAGTVLCLARQEHPDTSAYDDPEIVFRLDNRHHAGLIVRSPSVDRVRNLVDSLGNRFLTDFCAILPAPDRPTS